MELFPNSCQIIADFNLGHAESNISAYYSFCILRKFILKINSSYFLQCKAWPKQNFVESAFYLENQAYMIAITQTAKMVCSDTQELP